MKEIKKLFRIARLLFFLFKTMNRKKISILLIGLFVLTTSFSIAQTYSSFTDSRDGKIYKTVKIGTQTWMAENLNYKINDSVKSLKEIGITLAENVNYKMSDSSWCYDNNDSNCTIYGRLYTWVAAKIACPSGWHLPTDEEWQTLRDYLNNNKNYNVLGSDQDEVIGCKLKSSIGWNRINNEWAIANIKTINNSGFSALPGGIRSSYGTFDKIWYEIGDKGCWWSSSYEYSGIRAHYKYLLYNSNYIYSSSNSMNTAYSVRCIKDN